MVKSWKIILVLIVLTFLTLSMGYAESVKIIAEDDWFPYSAKFEEGPRGIAVDIVKAAFSAVGATVQFEVMNYDRAMSLVKEGVAIGCFDAPRTKEIENVYLWHDQPLFSAKSYFYANPDYKGMINSLGQVAGKKVGFTQGYGYGNAIDLDKGIVKEYSKSDTIIIKKLIAKRLELIVLFDKVADYLVSQLSIQGKIKQVGKADSSDLYIAFSKKHPDGKKIRDQFSRGLRKIKDDGTYRKIMGEWDLKLKGRGK